MSENFAKSFLTEEFKRKFPSAAEILPKDAEGRLIDADTESQPPNAQPPQRFPYALAIPW